MSSKSKSTRVIREDEILAQQLLMVAIQHWIQKVKLSLPIRFKLMDISRYGHNKENGSIEALIDIGVTQLRATVDFHIIDPVSDFVSSTGRNIFLRAPTVEHGAFLQEIHFKRNEGGYGFHVDFMSVGSAWELTKLIKEQNVSV
jgi:hypothetical protein